MTYMIGYGYIPRLPFHNISSCFGRDRKTGGVYFPSRVCDIQFSFLAFFNGLDILMLVFFPIFSFGMTDLFSNYEPHFYLEQTINISAMRRASAPQCASLRCT